MLRITCLLPALVALPLAVLQNPQAPSIYVAAFRTTPDSRILARCSSGDLRPREFPGPVVVPETLKPFGGLVPDPELLAKIEAEFSRIKRYRLAQSTAEADFVFVADGMHVAQLRGDTPPRPSHPRSSTPGRVPGLEPFP